MTHLTFIRYFVPDNNEFTPGWYQTRNEGRTRIGDTPLSLSDALYDGPNQVIIDDNTPETNILPVSGGKGVDEFLITRTANSVVIDDDSGANVIVFERDVVITSIERPAGSEGASVAQYVITLSSGKTITLRNPASFTFQHLGDVTRTDSISAEDFFTAYEDGFAASDASQPDITGANAAPTLVDAETATRGVAVNKAVTDITQAYLLSLFNDIDGDALTLTVSSLGSIGLSYNSTDGIIGTPTNPGLYTVKVVATDGNSGSVEKTLTIAVGEVVTEDDAGARFTGTTTGHISGVNLTFGSFEQNSGRWTYTLNSAKAQRLSAGEQKTDIVTFSDGTAVIVTVLGRNDAPVVDTAIRDQSGAEGQETVIDLSNLFSDIDTGDILTLSVTVELDGNEIVFDGSSNIISDPNANKMLRITLANTGTYRVTVVADDGNGGIVGSTFNIVVEADNPPVIGGTVVGTIAEDAASPTTGTLTITDADNDPLPTVVLTDGAGQYGTLTFVESANGGTWTYTLDNTNAAVQALKDDTLTDEFTFTAEGAEDVMVTITISGVNDAPTVSGSFIIGGGSAGDQFTLSNLSDRFTDVDQGDELTFTVTLDDGAALSTIGLTYDSDEDEITGTLSQIGEHVIKIVATDKSGATVEATFDLNIVPAIPEIQRNSLTYNPSETSITIDETMLKVTSGNQSDPTLLVYTITTLPDAGMLLKSGTPLNNGDTFTQADINNGLITYEPSVTTPSTSQSNPLSFTFSDGVETLEEQTLQITSREVFEDETPAEDNTIDRSGEAAPQQIKAGDGSDIITGGEANDHIVGGVGDDEIILSSNAEEDAGADEVLYTFGYDGVGIDGGDEIVGFKRGQDKVTFVVRLESGFVNLTAFLQSLKGEDDEDLTADDAFIVTMQWGTDEAGDFYFDGVLLHFKDASAFGGGRVSSPVVQITFDERLDFDGLVEILGGAENIANNFDFTHAAFKNLDEVLPRLFGEGSIGFKVIPFSVLVIDGPVTGAEVFFDIDDDGEVTDAEKDAQRDESGRSLYITGDDGTVSIPKKYVGLAFVAVVGSAYDTDSGERLEGEFRSLDKGRGGIATPITDLIVTYLEEVEGEPNAPTTEQEVLNKIFGDDVIMVSDVLVMENYELPESGAVNEVKKQMIATAAIALTKIKENDDLADGDADRSATKVEIASTINTLVATPEASSVTALKEAVDERVEEVNEVKGGKPIATPTSVDGVEDTDYAFPDTPEALTGLFGFLDPSGNSSSADASAFRGVYIKIDIENASLRLDDNTQVVASTDLSGRDSAPTIDGYVYVTFGRLDELKLSPAADFNGALKLVYQVWDGEAVSSDAELIINIAGVNDAPVVDTAIGPQRVTVDLPVTIDLSDLFTDVDGDELTLTVTGLPSGLSYARDTGITGTPDTEGTFTVTVVANDGNDGIVETTFDIVVAADNPPVIGGEVDGTIAEDADPITGTLTITDAEGDAVPPVALTDGAGQYGTMTFNAANGTWTYTLDSNNPDVQALKDDTLTEKFTFTAEGAEDVMVTITISGVNDAPVVASAIAEQTGTAGQAITAIDLSGLFTDVDTGDSFTLAVMVHDGSGRVGLDTLGLEYDSDTKMITGTLLNSVVAGTYTIEVIATDGGGSGDASAPSTFDIVIAAFNSPPVIGGAMDGTIAEDAAPITGTLTITDAESDPLPTVELTDGAGQYGTLTFTPSADGGVWTYTLDNNNAAVQALGKDDTLTDDFTFTAEGAAPITVTITISGVNDAPELVPGTEIGNQDGTVGQLIDPISESDLRARFADADTDNAALVLSVMVLSSDGSKSGLDTIGLEYNSTDGIIGTPSDSGTYTIEVTASDGDESVAFTFDIVITSQTISGDTTGSVTEDETLTATGVIEVTDVDNPPTLPTIELDGDGVGTYGTMTFDGRSWTYTLAVTPEQGGKTQALTEGQTETETFTFSAGALTFEVTITVTGVNDAPTLVDARTATRGVAVNKAVTDITQAYLLSLFNDIDGDALSLTVSSLGSIGLSYNSTDGITGTPTNPGLYTVKVVATDGNGESAEKTLKIAVGEVVSEDDAGARFTGTTTGNISSINFTFGSFELNSGRWTYTLNSAKAQRLSAGEQKTDIITFSDGTAVIVTVLGRNDAPVVDTAIRDQSGAEGQETVIDLSNLFSDIDTGDTLTLSVTVELDGNEIVFDGSSNIISDPNANKMLRITLANTGTYTVTVVADDGNGGMVESTFEIVVEAAPVIGGVVVGTIAEDAASPITGTLTITDADDDAVPTVVLTDGAGQYGTLTFVESADGGTWTYTLDSNNTDVQALKDDTLTDEFTFTAEGAEDVMVTITISGVNDAPVVASAIADQTGTAGQAITAIDLSGLFTDVDTGDSFTLAVMVHDGSGRVGLDTLGLEYDSDTKMITGTLLNSVVAGTYTIEVIATDGGGSGDASAPSTFDIVIAAFNSPPVIGGAMDGTIAEDAADPITGTLTIMDAESDPLPTVELTDGAGQYGTMTFEAASGTWTYTLNNNNPDVQALKDDTLTEEFTFTAEGAEDFVVTITITGVNDVPVVESGNEIAGQTGTVGQAIRAVDLSGLFTDVDTGDELTLTVMVLSSDGTTKTALDTIGLAHDSDTQMITGTPTGSGTYTIEVVAEDGNGGITAATFEIVVVEQTIEATAGGSTAAVTEDDETPDPVTGTLGIISGVTSPAIVLNGATDDDNDGTFILEGVYGRMEFVMSTGVWTYTLDNTKAETQALNTTDVGEDIFIFTSGSAGFAVTITVNGVDENQDPVVDTAIVEQGGTVGQSTSIDLSGLFTDPDGDTLTLTVMVLSSDGTTKTALDTIGLAYDSDTQMITGTPTGSGTYTIEVVAEDGEGGIATSTLDIVVVEQTIEATAGGSTAAVTEDDETQDSVTGTLGIISGVTSPDIVLDGATDDNNDGTFILEGVYGRMEFVMSTSVWTYTLDDTKAETEALNTTDVGEDIFIFTSGSAGFAVTITVNGANDAPMVDTAIVEQGGTVGQSTSIDLGNLFTDPEGDTLTLTVMVLSSDGTTKTALDTIGLAHDSDTQMITGTPTGSGTYTIEVVAEDGNGGITAATFDIVVVEQTIEATAGGSTAAVTEDDETQNSVTGTLGIISGVTSPAIVLKDATDDDNDGTFILEGVYGRMEFVMSTSVWTYTLDNAKAETEALNTTDVVEDIFIFTSGSAGFAVTITVNGADENQDPVVGTALEPQSGVLGQEISIDLGNLFTDPDGDAFTLMVTAGDDGTTALADIGLTYNEDTDPVSGVVTRTITGTPNEIGTYTLTVKAIDNQGGSETSTFELTLGLPDVTGLTKELGEGVADAAVGANDADSSQLLIGGDNAQTLNAGLEGDVIFGGRGDDTVTLGDGEDIVIYRYAGASPNDGADTVNGFDLDEDYLVLAHTGGPGSAHSSSSEFYAATTGVSLLVDGDGNITGVTFALDSDLTVIFDEAFDASAISNLLDTSFDPAASGVREITSGQDSNAYEAINVILGDSLVLVDFDDLGFELNSGETDLV